MYNCRQSPPVLHSLNANRPRKACAFRGRRKNLAASYFPARRCAVSSARKSLTAEFGMGSGVPSTPWLPKWLDGALSRGSGLFLGVHPAGTSVKFHLS